MESVGSELVLVASELKEGELKEGELKVGEIKDGVCTGEFAGRSTGK